MRFVGGGLNGVYMLEIHEQSIDKTDSLKIAVAYASGSPRLLEDCWKKKVKVMFWGRYDETNPVTLPILKTFLDRKSPNFVCKLVPDIFHAKVIWWEGYGAYIGSANLTENAWFGNIEAGIFFTEDELVESGLAEELSEFFEALDTHSYALTDEVYSELSSAAKINSDFDKRLKAAMQGFQKNRKIPKKAPLTYFVKTKAVERQKNKFLKEWQDTLQTLRSIADRVSQEAQRPSWITPQVPKGVQADQFLHAFYYSEVRMGNRSMHWEFHDRNRGNPEKALQEAMEWWHNLAFPPHNEDRTIFELAPFLREKLSKEVLLSLSRSEFVEVCSRLHALRDHSLRVKYTTFGSEPLPTMNSDQRIQLLAEWLYAQSLSTGGKVLDTINYVLWGGPLLDIPSRIFEASSLATWKIPHLGISTIGEIVGWALPDDFPPRNGRTSKALTALGYAVTIHSE
jgi:HKD family nuclease